MDFQFTQNDWYIFRGVTCNGEPVWNEAFSNNILTKFNAGQHFIIYWIETCHSHENNWSQCNNIPFFIFKGKDKVDNINVFGFRPTTLNCGRKEVIKYIWFLICDFLYK